MVAKLPPAAGDDKLSSVAVMGVFLGYDTTIVNGIRVGVLEDCLRKRNHPVKDVIVSTTARMKYTTFPTMDSHIRIEEDMCRLFTEEIEKSDSLEQRGQRRL